MIKIKIALFSLYICLFVGCSENKSIDPVEKYKDVSLSFETRAEHLVSLMTLEEKVGQMNYQSPRIERLDIPEYNWWNECLHGVARAGKATVFPQAIGLGAMFDSNQMTKVAEAISDEARAKHHEYASRGKRGIYQGLTFWTPNINIFRDPRWGRGMETYGEDPYLTGELAVHFIKGLQGNHPKYLKLVATAKHFAVHSGPEIDRHRFNATPEIQDMMHTYAPHFEKVVKEGGVQSIMCAYNSYNGLPCCGNPALSSLLRDEWGFDGYIVSDCWAIKDFYEADAHAVVKNEQEASAMAVKAGTDLNCGDAYPALVKAVKNGLITEAELDISVQRLFVARLKLGLFAPEGDVPYEKIPYDVVDSETHRLLALETARKSIVLLKNEKQTLPLSKSLKKVAVIGSNANDMEVLLGNYNGYPSQAVTPLEGIKQKLPDAEITYATGTKLAEGLPVFEAIPTEVLYTDASLKVHGLKATYFSNITHQGTPLYTRVDDQIDFIWETTPPFKDMSYDKYSVRWTGVLSVPEAGRYAIGGEAFSGMKIYIDDKLLIEREDVHHPKKEYEYITLEAGKAYDLKIEYKQNNTEYAMMRLLWEKPQKNLNEKAIAIAEAADVILLYMGISPLLEGEEMKVKVDGFSGGDRVHINLPATQTQLMQSLKALGKPMVLVLLNGSALSINWENEHIPAIVEAWYPGQAGGTAIADVLFGDYNPAGRLPLTFYKDINDIPEFSDYDMKGKTYRYFEGEALYEFGYGLSYTNFEYSNLSILDQISGDEDEEMTLSVAVENIGMMDGEEVVEVYIDHLNAGTNNPKRSLVGFQRVFIEKGTSKTLAFTIKTTQLFTIDDQSRKVIAPGKFTISVGGAQPSKARIANKEVISKTVTIIGKERVL